MEKSLKVSSILAVLIFVTQFISLPYISWYNLLRYTTIVLVGLYVGIRIKIVLQKKYLLVNIIAVAFSFLTVFTSFLNRSREINRDPFLASIPFVASFVLVLLFMEISADYGMIKEIIRVFFKTAVVFTVVTDILIFAVPSLFVIYNQRYFVGTKFDVVYLHMLLSVFYLTQNLDNEIRSYKNIPLLLLSAWSIFIGIYVDCVTGILGTLILLLLLVIIKNREELFLNGLFYFVIQALCFGFIFFYEFVLSNPTVEHFIVNIFGRDISLTARTEVYETVPDILTKHDGWLKGMGYGSSYELGMRYGGFPDTQNGILEWIWQVGIPTTVIMILTFAFILSVSKNYMDESNRKMLLPLVAGVYLMSILGTAEITISLMYFSLVVCVMGVAVGTCKDIECSNTEEDTQDE